MKEVPVAVTKNDGDKAHSIATYLTDVIANLEATAPKYASLMRSGVTTHPIPFFGNVEAAQVITIGVNPSAGEFVGRSWPSHLAPLDLAERLTRYFASSPTAPHPWFKTWSEALGVLGVGYQSGAAHVDLSPRATAAMGGVTNWKLFLDMIEADMRWFFQLLALCRSAKALLAAGCVTKRWYINDFVRRVAPQHGFRLDGHADRRGAGRVGIHRLVGVGVDLPMFFCSVSPSANNGRLLVQRVREHQSTIREWLDSSRVATAT